MSSTTMTARPMTEGLEPCPFCGAQPYVADPTNFPDMWEHPWEHKGCFLDGFNITGVTSWNRRAPSAAVRGMISTNGLPAYNPPRPYQDDEPDGYEESFRDHADNNQELIEMLLERYAALSLIEGEDEQAQTTGDAS